MNKEEVTRRCVGCGEIRPRKELMRVVSFRGEIRPDETLSADGRGAYICKRKACLEKAIKRKGLERSFRRSVDGAVYDRLSEALEGFEE